MKIKNYTYDFLVQGYTNAPYRWDLDTLEYSDSSQIGALAIGKGLTIEEAMDYIVVFKNGYPYDLIMGE